MRSHVSWRGERNIFYKGIETSPSRTHFKNLERKPKRESAKKTVSASGGLRLLQMVSKPGSGRCTSEEAEPRSGVDKRQCANEDAGFQRGWIVRSHIGWREERNILYKGVETSP